MTPLHRAELLAHWWISEVLIQRVGTLHWSLTKYFGREEVITSTSDGQATALSSISRGMRWSVHACKRLLGTTFPDFLLIFSRLSFSLFVSFLNPKGGLWNKKHNFHHVSPFKKGPLYILSLSGQEDDLRLCAIKHSICLKSLRPPSAFTAFSNCNSY